MELRVLAITEVTLNILHSVYALGAECKDSGCATTLLSTK